MKKDIRNYDKNGNYHGEQISYHSNDNITWIYNYNHGIRNGYHAWFKSDKAIDFKNYWNMNKLIYSENHHWSKQIQIKI